MNLIFIAALVAVCGAAKLDRTYLPPASAKTAGGAPGSLQTPFAGNSFNDNPSSLPKGSFTNEFQGVVVDAAAAGTRASGEGETGLGASRISYGSTNSKVGDAAFRGTAAGFRPFPGQNFNRQSQPGQNFDEQSGQSGQGFEGQSGQAFEGQNGQSFGQNSQSFGPQGSEAADGQTASSQVQSSAQGFNRGPQGSGQFNQGNRGASSFESKPERAQAAFDRTASTLRFENEVGPESYHYAFETDNGISAEENGVATNGVQAQGGFSYTGDDGQVYTVTYTADEGGYQPRGDHLPTPPPIPEEILKSLAKNAEEEAAGLVDDGSYDAQRYNAGGDYAESDGTNVEHNDRQTPKFGKQPSDATASGTFINQNNQPFVGQDGSSDSQDVAAAFAPANAANKFGQAAQASDSANNGFAPSGAANGFGQPSQSGRFPSSNGASAFKPNSNFGQAPQPSRTPSANNFGSRNEYLPPTNGFNQNGRPQRPSGNNGQSSLGFNSGISQASADASFGMPLNNGQAQNNGPQQNNQASQSSPSFGRPGSNGLAAFAQSSSNENKENDANEPSLSANSFAQAGQPSRKPAQPFGSRPEYLPPTFGQNTRPQGLRPQRPTQSVDATAAPSFNTASQASGPFQSGQQSGSTFAFNSGSTAQPSQQFNGFGQKRPQSFNNQLTQNRFPATQGVDNQNKEEQSEENQDSQAPNDFGSFNQRPTSQPSTELTTPFESSEQTQNTGSTTSFGFGSQKPTARPGSQFEGQTNSQSSSVPSRPQNRPTASQPQSSFSTQGQGQFAQPSFNANQPTSQNGFDKNESDDAQFSPSSERPSFSQGPDQSYYYRQPAKPFNTPSGSRFPSAPSGQFDRVSPQSSQAQSSAQFGASPQNFQVNAFRPQSNRGSTRYPEPPTLAPTSPTDSTDGQFQSTVSSQYNGITQASISPFQPQRTGSSKYPRPPGLTPTAPTLASQFNGITQATASSFTSAPSSPFGSRPAFQQPAFNQPQSPAQPNNAFAPQKGPEAENGQDAPQDVPTQQYNGEIYEYSKPPQGLPSTSQKEPTSTPQRGQSAPTGSQTRPQFSNNQDSNAQKPTQPTFGARPQFGSQPSQPQFAFNTQSSSSLDQPAQDSSPQYNAQPRPFAQPNQEASQTRPKCCQTLDSKLDSFRGSSQNKIASASASAQFGTQDNSGAQGQFGTQFSGPTSQPGAQSFAGRGEVFGGPRKPPSFDEQTGYHY